jgi:hypothetical protein
MTRICKDSSVHEYPHELPCVGCNEDCDPKFIVEVEEVRFSDGSPVAMYEDLCPKRPLRKRLPRQCTKDPNTCDVGFCEFPRCLSN